MTVVRFPPAAARASELARCPRMCALRATGAIPVEPTERDERYFRRGHLFQRYVTDQLRAEYGAANVIEEKKIRWPHGVGHADAYITTRRMLVEVASTVAPANMLPLKLEQLRIYLRFDDEADLGALYMINPSDLEADERPIIVTLDQGDIDRIDAAVETIGAAINGGDLPGRVCRKPSDGRRHLCPFIEPCFEGWEPEPLGRLDPALHPVVDRLYRAKQAETYAKMEYATLEKARREIEAELDPALDAGQYRVGPYKLTRSDRTRETFSIPRARAAGVPEPLIREHTKLSGFTVWSVEREETVADDEGAPF